MKKTTNVKITIIYVLPKLIPQLMQLLCLLKKIQIFKKDLHYRSTVQSLWIGAFYVDIMIIWLLKKCVYQFPPLIKSIINRCESDAVVYITSQHNLVCMKSELDKEDMNNYYPNLNENLIRTLEPFMNAMIVIILLIVEVIQQKPFGWRSTVSFCHTYWRTHGFIKCDWFINLLV